MAALSFQTYVDKENSSSFASRKASGLKKGLGFKPGKGLDENFVTPRKALGNLNKENQGLKSFGLKQSSAHPLKPLKLTDNTNLVTPRKALANINKDPRAACIKTPGLKPSCHPGSGHLDDIKKLSSKSSNDLGKKQKTAGPQLKFPKLLVAPLGQQTEEIEHMYIPPPRETDDDYEDIMPKSDRISTYIAKLVSWRPPCFGDYPFSDEEEERYEEEVMKKRQDIAKRLGQNLPSNDLDVPGLGMVYATCNIPDVGNPGASTVCTADTNGFCLIDHFMVTGPGPSGITSVTYDGVCICYYGYSGPNCATVDSSPSNPGTNRATTIAALAITGVGAYLISQLGVGLNPGALGP